MRQIALSDAENGNPIGLVNGSSLQDTFESGHFERKRRSKVPSNDLNNTVRVPQSMRSAAVALAAVVRGCDARSVHAEGVGGSSRVDRLEWSPRD